MSVAVTEPRGVPATHLQPRPREPTRLMKTFFSLLARFPGEPRLPRPPWRGDRSGVTGRPHAREWPLELVRSSEQALQNSHNPDGDLSLGVWVCNSWVS